MSEAPTNPAPAPAGNADDEGLSDWRVELPAYAGPMDLLLFLVKRHEIDLHDIPMAKLTEQYLLHMRAMKDMDVDRAAEFLVMAATLLEIKSRMIVPPDLKPARKAGDDGADAAEAPGEDPRLVLVQQLLAYKRFKDAAWKLEARQEEFDQRMPVRIGKGRAQLPADAPKTLELDIEDLNILDLTTAFTRLMELVGHGAVHAVTYDDTPIAVHAEDMRDLLEREAAEHPERAARGMSLRQLFAGRRSKSEMIGVFLATLELVRNFVVNIELDLDADGHPRRGDPDALRLVLRPAAERERDQQANDTAKEWKDPVTGAPIYAWPDADTQKRAEKRMRLRALLSAKREAEAKGRKFDMKAWKKQQAALAKAKGAAAEAAAAAELEALSEDDLLEEEGFAGEPGGA